MSEWKTRTTRLVRDNVKVSVMSFMIEAAKRWRTCFMVHAEDNPMVSYEGLFWSDAKKKRPRRRQPLKAQRNNIST